MVRFQRTEEVYIKKALNRLGLRWFLINLATIFMEKADLSSGKYRTAWKELARYFIIFSNRYKGLDNRNG